MEDNKNFELEQNQNNEEMVKEEVASIEQKEEIDADFIDIDKDEMKKKYIIIGILYFIVIILSIFLVIGIKNQKDTVKDKIDNDKEINEKVEEEKNDSVITEETPKDEEKEDNNIPDTNNNNNNNNELNILDQI